MSFTPGIQDTDKIVKTHWGTVDGADVWLYTLDNGKGMKLVASNYGCILQSLFVPDKNGQPVNVVLGFDLLQDYINDPSYIGAAVGRYANRIAGASFKLNGKTYTLPANLGTSCLHGGFKGFSKRVFEVTPGSVDNNPAIRFTYLSPDGEEGFPGNLTVAVTYTVTEENEWIVDFEATTDQDTVINLCQHAYFNLSGNPGLSAMDHQLAIYTGKYLPANQLQLPAGTIDTVENTPFDFRTMKVVSQMLDESNLQIRYGSGYDHSFVLEKINTGILKKAAKLYEPGTGIQMTVHTTEPAIHFYSGNFLGTDEGIARSKKFINRTALCLETQHFPDSPNQPHFPSTVLKTGKVYKTQTIFGFQNIA